jgi:hypothetical protein
MLTPIMDAEHHDMQDWALLATGLAAGRRLHKDRPVQIELAKNVAARPAQAFAVLTSITEWPQIVASIKDLPCQ